MTALQVIWFALIVVLLVGYAVLDGFDLGVGYWHLFTRKEEERRSLLAAIGPFWDGNEVWLVTAAGALFAAFPPVYATLFSSLYLPLMLVLLALILRAVAIEFRGKEERPAGRRAWDIAFAAGSVLAALLFGVAFGNLLRGLPLDPRGNATGNVWALLNTFALLIGILNVGLAAVHGALFLAWREKEALADRARRWAQAAWVALLPLALLAVVLAGRQSPHLLRNFQAMPALWLLPAAALLSLVLAGVWNARRRPAPAFAASSAAIATLIGSGVVALFPVMIPASGVPGYSLTAANASSSPLTLQTMLVVAVVGMPLVLGYTWWWYRTFGKADDSASPY